MVSAGRAWARLWVTVMESLSAAQAPVAAKAVAMEATIRAYGIVTGFQFMLA
jgi:hypothetical protein